MSSPEFSPEQWRRAVQEPRMVIMVETPRSGGFSQVVLSKEQYDAFLGFFMDNLTKEGPEGRPIIPAYRQNSIEADNFLGFKKFYTEDDIDNDF